MIKKDDGPYPAFTTLKHREKEGWVKRTIDYMFLMKNKWLAENELVVEQFMDPKDLENDGQINQDIGNPCPTHPSDHYSIAY